MLDELTGDLWIAWQPIYNLRTGSIWGHEALIRGPVGHPFETPQALFELARREAVDEQFEERCRFLAFRSAARDLARPGTLFVNANPRFVGLPIAPPDQPWSAEHTVVEISESSPLFDDPEALQAQVAAWRAQGFRIALDDFGSGFAGEAAILALHPDVVKIDQRFIHGIDKDAWRQEIVSVLVHMCSDLGVAVVAEGIETPSELDEVVMRGVVLGQGFLLGPPAREPKAEPMFRDLPGRALEEAAQDAAGGAGLPRYVVDRARRILYWSPEAEALTGHSAISLTGTTCWLSGLDHRDADGTRLCFRACPLVTAMRTGETQRGVVSLRREAGEREWVEISAQPIVSKQGEVVGAVETFGPLPAQQETAAQALDVGEAGETGGLGHHLFWRKEVARWLARWQGGEDFTQTSRRFVNSLPFHSAALWQPQPAANRCVALAGKQEGDARVAFSSVPLQPPTSIVAQAYDRRSVVRVESGGRHGTGVRVAIPLMHAGIVQGVLTIADESAQRLPDAAVAAIGELAPLLGTLISNQELLGSLQRKEEIFRWMLRNAQIALDYQPTLEPDDDFSSPSIAAFHDFRRGWDRIAGVRGGALWMRESSGNASFTPHDQWGIFTGRGVRARMQQFLAERLGELPESGWLPQDHPLQVGTLPNYLHVVRDQRDPVAVLLVAVASRDREADLLPVFEFTSLATVNRRRQRELLHVAERDPLTGALNRRALEERLEAFLRGRRRRSALFALVDVDDLKRVNDQQGHQAADLLLHRFADHARRALRPEDEVARIGGDEFVFVLYDAPWGESARQRLHAVLAQSPLAEFGTGATCGAVELPREAHTFAEAYRLADHRLYSGKEAGKGIVVGGGEAPSA